MPLVSRTNTQEHQMKKQLIAAAAAAALILGFAPAVSATTVSVVSTKASDYSTKSKNRYWNAVKSRSYDAVVIGKKDTIGMGVAVCDLLRAGGDLYDLAALVAGADPIIEEVLIVSMAAAPVYLCKDQAYKFE